MRTTTDSQFTLHRGLKLFIHRYHVDWNLLIAASTLKGFTFVTNFCILRCSWIEALSTSFLIWQSSEITLESVTQNLNNAQRQTLTLDKYCLKWHSKQQKRKSDVIQLSQLHSFSPCWGRFQLFVSVYFTVYCFYKELRHLSFFLKRKT